MVIEFDLRNENLNNEQEALVLEKVIAALKECGVDTDKMALYVNHTTDGELDIDG